jgi:hypothetical protein
MSGKVASIEPVAVAQSDEPVWPEFGKYGGALRWNGFGVEKFVHAVLRLPPPPEPAPGTPVPLLTTAEVAKRLRLSVRTVRRRCAQVREAEVDQNSEGGAAG